LGGGIGDEGGFAPDLDDNREALALMAEAVERSGYALGDQIAFALDPAASEFYEDGTYELSGERRSLYREEIPQALQ
jgi:enolase